MGMTVLAYTLSPRPTPESRRDQGYIVPGTGDPDGTLPFSWHSGQGKAALHDFLCQDLDHILLSVPLTPLTTKLLGAEEFAILSQSCTRPGRRPFVTNISRGKVIDQDALIVSLKSGELSGAAIDVADPEPLPPDHPLWDTPNLQISSHMSALGVEYLGRALDVLKVNLSRIETGERLVNVYRRTKGY
jgi:phosphoglycerate dehydrogenase-like enzyme